MTATDARPLILIVDDEAAFSRLVAMQLEARGFATAIEDNALEAADRYARLRPDAVIVDLQMPDLDGYGVIAAIRAIEPAACLVMLSGNVDVPRTVRALRAGAEDVLTKPHDADHLAEALRRGIERTGALRRQRVVATQVSDQYGLLDGSPLMERIVRAIEVQAANAMPVLIVGETGTGKRSVAQMVHRLSTRADRAFVRVECGGGDHASVSAQLLGAHGHGRGAIVRAHGGTLCLEDVHDLPIEWQQHLVALMRGEPAGGAAASLPYADFRLIATTTRDLAADVSEGRMRADFYQRIAVLPISLPPVRRRGEDAVRTVATRMLHALHAEAGRGPRKVSDEAAAALAGRDWPGNFPQLARVLEGAALRALGNDELDVSAVTAAMAEEGLGSAEQFEHEDLTLAGMERRHIARVLARMGGNRSDAARALDITRTTLYKKMSDFGLGDVGRE